MKQEIETLQKTITLLTLQLRTREEDNERLKGNSYTYIHTYYQIYTIIQLYCQDLRNLFLVMCIIKNLKRPKQSLAKKKSPHYLSVKRQVII